MLNLIVTIRLEVEYQEYLNGKMPVMGMPLGLFMKRWNNIERKVHRV
jgi:hypothetical protein